MRTETVTRLRGRYTDGGGNPIGTDWSNPDELPIVTLAPAEPWSSGDPEQSGSWGSYLSGWRLYLRENADVTSRDRVQVRGQTFTPVREPADWLGGGLVLIVGDVVTATCTIRHPGATKGPFNTTTGTYPTTPLDPHYTGGCQVRPLTTREREELSAEEMVTRIGYQVIVDLDPSAETEPGDVVEITEIADNGDPTLLNTPLQVRAFVRGELPWQRNLRCSLFLPKS